MNQLNQNPGLIILIGFVVFLVFLAVITRSGGKSHEELEMDQEKDFFDRLAKQRTGHRPYNEYERLEQLRALAKKRLRVTRVWDVEPDNLMITEGEVLAMWHGPAGEGIVALKTDDGHIVTVAYYYPPPTPGFSSMRGETIIEAKYV